MMVDIPIPANTTTKYFATVAPDSSGKVMFFYPQPTIEITVAVWQYLSPGRKLVHPEITVLSSGSVQLDFGVNPLDPAATTPKTYVVVVTG